MPKSGGGHIFMVPIDLPKCPNATPTVRPTHTQLRADNDNHLQIYTSDGQSRTVYDSSNLPSTGMENPMTDAGDIIVGGTDGEPERLGIGTANYVLGVNNAGTAIEYSDGSAIPAVAQNTSDINGIKSAIDTAPSFYLYSDETSSGSGVYKMSTTVPTASAGTTLSGSVTGDISKLFEFQYTFPSSGTIYRFNSFNASIPFSGLDSTKIYSIKVVVSHVSSFDSTKTQIGSKLAVFTSATSYTLNLSIPNTLTSDISVSAGDKLDVEIYGVCILEPSVFTAESLPSGSPNLNSITYGNGLFVTVGSSGGIYTSPDGSTWTSRSITGSPNLYFVSYENGVFIAGGYYSQFITSNRAIYTSPDGVTWTMRYSYSDTDLYPIYCGCYGLNRYVCGGDEYTYYSSENSYTGWNTRTLPSVRAMYGVIFVGSSFYGVGTSGSLFTSSDGINWSRTQKFSTGSTIYGICYGNGLFVTVGSQGLIYTSTNGSTWTSQTSGVLSDLKSVCYSNGIYVAVGVSGAILTSQDGVTWTVQTSGVSSDLNGIASSGDGSFQIVGNSGTVLLGVGDSTTNYECDIVVEDTTDLARLQEYVKTTILADQVVTTVNNVNQTQQAYNESVATSLAGKQDKLTASTGISISSSNAISATKATSSALGIVRPDNSTITVNSSGVISCSVTSGMTNPMTTQGDIIVGGASGTPARLGIGTTGQVLTVNSNADGVTYQDLPIATTLSAGIVQPDGTTVTINNGVISSTGSGSVTTFRYWN